MGRKDGEVSHLINPLLITRCGKRLIKDAPSLFGREFWIRTIDQLLYDAMCEYNQTNDGTNPPCHCSRCRCQALQSLNAITPHRKCFVPSLSHVMNMMKLESIIYVVAFFFFFLSI